MLENIENLKILSSIHRTSKATAKVENRKTHSLFVRTSGTMRYLCGDEEIIVHEGEILFTPKGSSYNAEVLSDSASYTAIHFEGDFKEEVKLKKFSPEGFYELDYLSACFADMWNMGNDMDKYKCMSLFYSLLAYLVGQEKEEGGNRHGDVIAPAVEYLKKHIYDPTLKIEKLHRLCGVSDTYFRKLFILKYGISPKNYVASKRLDHAKAMITSGDYNSVGEVALAVGFNDPLYFSKAFKRKYGISPTEAVI